MKETNDPNPDHGFPSNPYNTHCWITGKPRIGEGTWIGAFTLIDGQGGLEIGRGCDISSGAQILTHSTVKRCVSERKYDQIDYAPTSIGDYVFIGTNSVIMMGSQIGDHCVIAAGAVVLEHSCIAPYSLVAGVPARIVRDIHSEVDSWRKGDRACQN